MRIKLLFLGAIFFIVSTHSAFAAGGACPTSANYLNTTNPAGALVTLSSLGVTNCFYVAANGSDSNSGTSEAAPWQHAPGMSSCTANCGANTPSGGTGYIFRGGDTWHMGNSGASPFTNGWNWSWNGSSQSVPIYVGVDPGWFSGSSWARPILNGDNPLQGCAGSGPCPVASCPHSGIGGSYNQMVTFNGHQWNVFDDFEFTGFCWSSNSLSGSGGNVMLAYYAASGNPYFFVIERNYFHGWSHTSGGTQGGASAMEGNSNQGYGVVIQFNVVDGSDSDDLSLSSLGANDTSLWITRYNYIGHTAGDVVASDCHYIHDNIFEYYNFVTDGSGHGDEVFCENEYSGGSGSPNLWFNNVWRHVGTEYNVNVSYIPDIGTPGGQTDYIFNNVWHDNQPATGGGAYLATENKAGAWVLFNNTGEEIPNGWGCIVCNGTSSSITSVNNHWIASPATEAQIYQTTGGVSESNAVYMTQTTASNQGFASSNDFAPTSASAATVGVGANETNVYCTDSVLHYAIAEAECVNGTSDGISYNLGNHTVSYPGIGLNPRPSTGAWDVGAFEYGGGGSSSVQPPTSVTVAVQ